MKHLIYPCIWYDHNAKEAAEFYCSLFPGSTIKECTPMVVSFYIKGKQFMGLNGGTMFKPNPSISLFTICETVSELEEAWDKLSKEGRVMMALDRYPWSEKYGWVEDKYGVSWQLSLANPGDADADIFPALMFTGDQNGNAEKAIHFYTSLFENSAIELIAKYESGEHDKEGHVKYAQFYIDEFRMSAMDSTGPHHFTFSEGLSLVVNCDTQEEIDFYWLNLSEGGQESNCGWCQDQFGVWWQIVPAILSSLMSDPAKAPKVMEAFMKMKKFNIKALEEAAGV
jgi:predicted 3-demethylubiquinone-9 3-methyltransferase (glyoxalase superfamily)